MRLQRIKKNFGNYDEMDKILEEDLEKDLKSS